MPRARKLVYALGLLLWPLMAPAATPDQAIDQLTAVEAKSQWVMHGGTIQLRFNIDRLSGQGIHLAPAAHAKNRRPDYSDFVEFPVYHGDGLRFAAPKGNFEQFTGGKIAVDGGFTMRTDGGLNFDYSRFELRADPDNPMRLQLIGVDGKAWFYVNHVMYKLVDEYAGFNIRSADLRATEAFAARVGAENLADAYVGELSMFSNIVTRPTAFRAPKASLGSPNFHGTNGFQADVLLTSYTMDVMRCRTSLLVNGCNGIGGDDGDVVFAPSSTLRNTNTATTADVSWYQKFTTSPYSYPYPGNDQHPYLVWALYRVNDGQLQQIGASGVKHAFLTTNGGCTNPHGNHILSRNCSDTYGTGNNDNTGDLGPRREIIPATGRWGRCFSIFDTDCNGAANPVGSSQYQNRLIAKESQLELAGSTFYSDSWYVIQDDINIFNTMGHRTAVLTPVTNTWDVTSEGAFTLGPVLNTWVNPVTNPTQNVDLKSAEGNVKAAVKVKTLNACPGGLLGTCYRYDYVVHNFDLARAVLNTTAPANAQNNLQVLSNIGIVSVSLPRGADAPLLLEAGNFADIDVNVGNNWTSSLNPNAAVWTATAGNELNWGLLFRFSVVSNIAPDPNYVRSISLGMQPNGGPGSYPVELMVPNTFDLFSDSLE